MPEDIIKAKWFNDSRGVIGIVRVVKEDLRPCYFIGTGCILNTFRHGEISFQHLLVMSYFLLRIDFLFQLFYRKLNRLE